MNSESVSVSHVREVSGTWPTRYTLVIFMLVTYVIGWAVRINFTVATPKIMSAYGWNRTQMGMILSAFTWAFVVFKLPAGWLADRFGGMKTMIGGILFCSFITLLFPLSASIAVMAALRFLLGVGEITYPPSQVRLLSRWFPDNERPKINGICLAASSVGQLTAGPLAAWLLISYGWHMVFYAFGIFGILWAVGFWRWDANPETENRLNEQYRVTANKTTDKLSWRRMLRLRSVWGLVLVYICLTYCFWLFLNWLPTYLIEARGFTFLKAGFYSALPAVAQGGAQIAAGWISTYLITRGFSKNFSRKAIMGVCFLGASLFLILIVITLSPMLSVVYISASLAFLGACYTPIWTLPTDLTVRWPGTVFGFVGTIGFLGGAVAPIVTGYIVDHTGNWHLAFYLASAISVVGFLATMFLISSDSVDSQLQA